MIEIQELQGATPNTPQSALRDAQRARLQAQRACCEMEEFAASLHERPPVGRWPQLTRASFGPSVSVLSG